MYVNFYYIIAPGLDGHWEIITWVGHKITMANKFIPYMYLPRRLNDVLVKNIDIVIAKYLVFSKVGPIVYQFISIFFL